MWFILPKAETTLTQFFHVRRAATRPPNPLDLALITDAAPVGMPPLSAIRWLDVGEHHPATFTLNSSHTSRLQIKNCCLSSHCIPSERNRCNGLDTYYDLMKARRAPRGPSVGFMDHVGKLQLKRARQEEQTGALRLDQKKILDQQTALVTADPMAAFCLRWARGRCAKHHPTRHGTAEQTSSILCTSAVLPSDPKYDSLFTTCPFAVVSGDRGATCPYGGHWTEELENMEADIKNEA